MEDEATMKGLRRAALAANLLLACAAWAGPGVMIREDQLRSAASPTAAVTGKVSKGASVEVLSRQGGWTQIRAAGKTGWVRLLSVRAGAAAQSDVGGELGAVLGMGTRQSDPSRVVSVAGVRGLNEEDLKAARYSPQEIERLERYAVGRGEAEQFARQAGLASRQVEYLPAPVKQAGADSPWGETP